MPASKDDDRTRIYDAVSGGDRRKSLTALRDEIASAIDNGHCVCCADCKAVTRGSDLAALSLRLMKVIAELEGLPDANATSSLDRLSARVSAGGPATPDSTRPSGGQQRRFGGRRTGGDGGSQA